MKRAISVLVSVLSVGTFSQMSVTADEHSPAASSEQEAHLPGENVQIREEKQLAEADKSQLKKADNEIGTSSSSKQAQLQAKKASVPERSHNLPKRLAAFAIGAVVGAPIATVRQTIKETKAANVDLIQQRANPFFVAPATLVNLPFAAVAGGLEGPFHSVKNSWENSEKKPFSKDAFGLGPMEE